MPLFDVDLWQEIYDSISRHKLRTLLTAFGVFWGIFMLVNLVGVGNGLRNGAEASMSLKNGIYVWSGRPTSMPYKGLSKGRSVRLDDDDIAALRNQVPGLDVIAPGNGMGSQFTVHGSRNDSFETSGVWPVEMVTKGYDLLAGRLLNELDLAQLRKVAVIGERIQEVLFAQDENPIGAMIEVAGVKFKVVGVVRPQALNGWAQRDMSKIFLPHSTLRKTFNQGDRIHVFTLTTRPGFEPEAVEQAVLSVLKERHKVHPQDWGVIGSYNAHKDVKKVEGLFTGIKMFSWFVAVGTIIAGAVGVGNIMLITVAERTREIGVRKALGATPNSIVGMVLQESLVITVVAGYSGLVAGVLTLQLIDTFASRAQAGPGTFINPQIDFSTALVALLVLVIAGALAAVLPARKAAAVDPVIALQDE
ncbi:ABC transporter permease [Teredinibacter turnerae]|uniref:ABC transporter permease n=1 Tax=Teredinibacter turnerae TaxID=2426 RepID=UPI000368DDC1|nr:ABC transporter permease [Teredinibacter turnerae]